MPHRIKFKNCSYESLVISMKDVRSQFITFEGQADDFYVCRVEKYGAGCEALELDTFPSTRRDSGSNAVVTGERQLNFNTMDKTQIYSQVYCLLPPVF